MINEEFDYPENPDQMLVDIADDPNLAAFIDRTQDLEVLTLTQGGYQLQVQALKRSAIRRVIDRIVAFLEGQGFDIEPWICGREKGQFDFCGKHRTLNRNVVIKTLRDYLRKKWVEVVGGAIGELVPPIRIILLSLSVLGLLDDALLKLCRCEHAA